MQVRDEIPRTTGNVLEGSSTTTRTFYSLLAVSFFAGRLLNFLELAADRPGVALIRALQGSFCMYLHAVHAFEVRLSLV